MYFLRGKWANDRRNPFYCIGIVLMVLSYFETVKGYVETLKGYVETLKGYVETLKGYVDFRVG